MLCRIRVAVDCTSSQGVSIDSQWAVVGGDEWKWGSNEPWSRVVQGGDR